MGIILCPECGAVNQPDSAACQSCGAGLDAARHHYQQARQHYQRALSLLEEEALDDAVQALEAAIELAPHAPEFHNLLGIVFARRGKYELAQTQWRQALLAYPDQAEAFRNMERAQQMLDNRYLQRIQWRPWRGLVAALGVIVIVAVAWGMRAHRQAAFYRNFIRLNATQASAPENDSASAQLQEALLRAQTELGETRKAAEQLRQQLAEAEKKLGTAQADAQQKINLLNAEMEGLRKEREQRLAELAAASTAGETIQLSTLPEAPASVDLTRTDPPLAGLSVAPEADPPPPTATPLPPDPTLPPLPPLEQVRKEIAAGNRNAALKILTELRRQEPNNPEVAALMRSLRR